MELASISAMMWEMTLSMFTIAHPSYLFVFNHQTK